MLSRQVRWASLGVFLAAFAGAGLVAPQAQGAPSAASQAELQERRIAPLDGWRLFGGAGVGYGAVSGKEFGSSPRGGQYLLNANFGYTAPRWVAELGIGWLYNRVSGQEAGGDNVWIRTRSGLAEATVRYRLGARWQFGPVLGMSFGADTRQSASYEPSASSFHLGARLAYELPVGEFPIRFWQQVSTDVNVPDRRFVIAMAGVQIGLPIRIGGSKRIGEDQIRISAAAPVRGPDIKVILDTQRVFFNTNSARMKPEVSGALHAIGEFLASGSPSGSPSGSKEVDLVEVTGHADRRGRYEYNLKLSDRRATSVSNAMESGGVSRGTLSQKALSYTQPIDTDKGPKAHARNRRVEIMFINVRNPDELMKRLEPLMDLKPVVD